MAKVERRMESHEYVLLERIKSLTLRMAKAQSHSPEYLDLSVELTDVARRYGTLRDATRGITRPKHV
jgi:hypothetical protein